MKTNYGQRESAIERKVKSYAQRSGWVVRKWKSPGHKSVPDDIFLKDGMVFFIEFKAPGKKPNKQQLLEHGELRARGFEVYVVDNIGNGYDIIDDQET